MYTQDTIDKIVSEALSIFLEAQKRSTLIEVEVSARHVHLSQATFEQLFGIDSSLTFVSELSQPGQFVAAERVNIKGPKGSIQRVAILGPLRNDTQVEISLADARVLGISAPIRDSGDILETPGITLIANDKEVVIDKGVIIAARHIHLDEAHARYFGLKDQDKVSVAIESTRSLVFDNVLIRVSNKFSPRMHIDTDEANACACVPKKTFARIISKDTESNFLSK